MLLIHLKVNPVIKELKSKHRKSLDANFMSRKLKEEALQSLTDLISLFQFSEWNDMTN